MTHQPQLIPDQPSPEQAARDAERAAYLERLREKLKDPEFRAIEGFPLGEDEDILALSDPPYYTACPNPFLPEIIERWQAERAEIRRDLGLPGDADDVGYDDGNDGEPGYHREPFASDVSEGKNDPIYNAHSYHTKVPHKAVMRYILHYTDPGDIVFDGFCGTGMTGVAAQLCGDKKTVESLGYQVRDDGKILDEGGQVISRLGARKAALVDLSPAATFIAYNYNTPVDMAAFEREAKRILRELETECGWMYETWHPSCDDPQRVKARINYTVWSEVFVCPHCGAEIIYFDSAVDKADFRVKKVFACSECGAQLEKRSLERQWEVYYDGPLQRTLRRAKFQPVLINYQLGKNRGEKKPDSEDHNLLQRIDNTSSSDWYPAPEMPDGERKGKDGYHLKGITHMHQFYFRRPLLTYTRLWTKVEPGTILHNLAFLEFYVQGSCLGFTKMNRYSANHYSQVNRYFSGTLFVGSLISEVSPAYSMTHKLKRLSHLKMPGRWGQAIISCQSATHLPQIPAGTFDYVFLDPPFGNNLHYSELNFFWEAWLRVLTERDPEAVMDKGRSRTLADYQELMFKSFREVYRTLKPGHWVTVEFHNSQNRVWNAIQEAMLRAGFVVADVRTLDKQQETYKQSVQKLVKQDLVISAYRPRASFEHRFLAEAGGEEGVWTFVRQHLEQVPIVVEQDGALEAVAERQAYLLYDRMVAFHIQRGFSIPLGAAGFYAGLLQRFPERDGMYFLPHQVAEYDQRRLHATEIEQLVLFLTDEKSAIQWLRQELDPATGSGPQTYKDIQPKFLRELHTARHEDLPELSEMLEQNFLKDERDRWYVPDPAHQGDLEQLRERSLLREFQEYAQGKGRLRVFRTEAVRTGFKHAWHERDYKLIVKVAERLPESVLQEDAGLLMYYDNALMRAEEEPEQGRFL